MQIIIDNIIQTWWNIDSPPIVSLVVGAVMLSLLICFLFGLYFCVSHIATNFWQTDKTSDIYQVNWDWASLKKELGNNFDCPPAIFSTILKQKSDCMGALLGLLSAWIACLFLPWSASHCNLPSQVALSGFGNQADLLCFFGFISIACLPELALVLRNDKQLYLQELLWQKLSWLGVFFIACLGPVVLANSLSVSEVVKNQAEGMFGFSWLGLYFIPCFLGTATAIICFYNWQHNLNSAYAQMAATNDYSPPNRFLIKLTGNFNFFALICLFILLFGGGWNVPNLVYPAYINLGFLIASDVDLVCGLLVFILKLTILSALWPCLYHYLKKRPMVSLSIGLTLAIFNFIFCLILAIFNAVYVGG